MVSHKSLPDNVTLEDLLEQLKSNDEKVVHFHDDVLSFLTIQNIKPGKHPIKTSALYKVYKVWSKSPVSGHAFSLRLSNFFIKEQNHILIDTNPVLLLNKLTKPKRNPLTNNRFHTRIQNFIKKYTITEGSYWIEGYILYSLFDAWCYKNKTKQLTEKVFLDLCEVFFDIKIKNDEKYIGLNKSILDWISPTLMEQLRQGRKYGLTRKKRKEKKESNKKV